MKQNPESRLKRYGFAVVATAGTLIISALVQVLFVQNTFLLFVATVALSTWYGGLGPGLFSTVLSVLAVDYFILTPQVLFDSDDIPRILLFGAVALFVSYLTESQRRAQRSADEQRVWFQTTLASIGDGVIATDINGRITFMNAVAQLLTGWTVADALGKDIQEVFTIVDAITQSPAANPIVRVLRDGIIVGLANHTVLITRDGKKLPIDDSGAPIYDELKKTLGAVLVFRDVSEQQRTRQLEMQLAALVKSSDDAIIGLDLAGTITSWNKGAERMYGYGAAEVLGKSITLLLPESWPNDVPQILERIQRGDSIEHYETRRMGKDGTVLDVSLTISPIRNDEGQVVGVSKIARDITAHKRADERQHFLNDATALLSASMDYETTLKGLAQLMVPVLADWCSVHVLEDTGRLRTIDVASRRPDIIETLQEIRQRYPFASSASEGIAEAIRTGQIIYHPEIDPALIDSYSRDDDHRRLMAALSIKSSMSVPLRARDRVLGVMSLNISEGNRRYNADDLATAEEIARRAAIALDNARLASRIARLQTLTAALSESLTPAEVASVIINQGLDMLGAIAGSVALLDEEGTTIRIINSIGYPAGLMDAWRVFTIDSATPIAESVRTGKASWLETTDERQQQYPELITRGPIQDDHNAWATLPLLVEGQAIGALGLSFAGPREFSQDDRTFMITLANNCAQAIHRARLYEAEQRALTAAEAAIHTRDEFLSVAAHELKTPITSLRGFGQVLARQIDRDGTPNPERLRRVLTAIDEQTVKLSALVSQLLDISRLEAGRLVLDKRTADVSTLIEEAVSRAQTTTIRHTVTANVPAQVQVEVDSLRLEQVLTNLLDNAIKYSPDGGPIQVDLIANNGTVRIVVADRGPGIAPEHRERIFDKFYQAQTRSVQGMGLGLFISREIVTLHGGEIEAQFPPEGGSRFVITLPAINHSL